MIVYSAVNPSTNENWRQEKTSTKIIAYSSLLHVAVWLQVTSPKGH